MTSRRRSIKFLSVLASATLVVAACSDDDDDAATDTETDTGDTGAAVTTGDTGAVTTAGDTGDTGADTTTGDTGGDTTTGDTGTTTAGTGGDTTTGDTGATGGEPEGTFPNAQEQEFFAFNPNLSTTNAAANGLILNKVLPDTFYFQGGDGALVMDEELLDSAEITSEDPQVIEYVINADAVWSDGDPIDCDDFYLNWVGSNGVLTQVDDAGAPVLAEDGETPLLLFDTAGTTGFEQIESVECSEDGKTVTTTFATPFADWNSIFTDIMPAHIVEQEAGIEDIQAAYEAGAAEGGDRADIEAAAEFYNTGWSLDPGVLMPEIMPSGGPLTIGSWEAGSSLTLVPNEAFWGTPARSAEIVVRYIEQDAQAQALANREVLAIEPQPNPEVLGQLSGMDGVEVFTGDEFTFEHYDFQFSNPALANRDVREAFALCVPRQQIVDNLIIPLNPNATVNNNRWFQTFEEGYTDTSGGLYDEVNIEEATALLQGAGVPLPLQIRLGYQTPNQRRTDQVALLKASCDQAGFEIMDAGSDTFFETELPEGNFDVAMFAWTGGPNKTGASSTYVTGGGNNQGNYTNPEVDALVEELNQTLDPEQVNELATEVDTLLWEDLATIPVFTFPGLEAHDETTSGVEFNPTQSGLTWNAHVWAVA